MSELAKEKRIPGKGDVRAKKQLKPVRDQKQESEAIERAVYDGMQDLRVKKSK